MGKKILQLAPGLSLPLDAVTQTFGILAKRRAGKSYAARRFTEQLLKLGQQVVIVDPKGDWWGIRSAADGKAAGFPVVIIGGEHGDVKLEPGGGEIVAKLVIEERVSVLLDLSLLRKHEVSTFMTGFLETLYRMKAREQYRTPMMLVIDEADAIAPQKPHKTEERMLGAADDIVRRGGQRGIGCTFVSQRSAVLNKNVLTQLQVLVTLRTMAPQDLKAIKAWVDVHGSVEQQRVLMASLPSLPVGDAWFWSPGWPTDDGIFVRAHVAAIETFDSGSTPKHGRRVIPKTMAEVDLHALTRQMAATIERTKAEDPRELTRRIRELERAAAAADTTTHERAQRKLASLEQEIATLKARPAVKAEDIKRLEATARNLVDRLEAFAPRLDSLRHEAAQILTALTPPTTTAPRVATVRAAATATATVTPPRTATRAAVSAKAGYNGAPSKMQRAMLAVLAKWDKPLSKRQILLLTGYKSSGPVSLAFAHLVREGLTTDAGENRLQISAAGRQIVGPFDPVPRGGAALQKYLLETSKPMESAILKVLIDAHPENVSKANILERANYKSSGPVSLVFARLVALGYATPSGPSFLRASGELFEESQG